MTLLMEKGVSQWRPSPRSILVYANCSLMKTVLNRGVRGHSIHIALSNTNMSKIINS